MEGILGTVQDDTIRVSYKNLEAGQRCLFDKFEETYGSRIPKRFLTELLYGQESKDIGVYCWRIRCSENRQVVEKEPAETSAKTADPP